jgi:hypothetical protein
MPVGSSVPQAGPVNSELSRLNNRRRTKLTKFQEHELEEGQKHPVYIYNVSPIHRWDRYQGQLGTLVINKCDDGQRVSEPLIIPGCIVRYFDKGFGKQEAMIEGGMEIAEDICGCSKEYPPDSPTSNLTNYGVFILQKPIDEYPEKKQLEFINEALQKLIPQLQLRIQEADQWWQGVPAPVYKGLIVSIHRDALRLYNELTGSKEERPWATIRYQGKATEECKFCGFANRSGVVKCQNCHEILDTEQYEKLKKGK